MASENPVYVQGNYNSVPRSILGRQCTNNTPHAAAAIIADAVTLLSGHWTDRQQPDIHPTQPGGRPCSDQVTTGWRSPGARTSLSPAQLGRCQQDMGTDGGLHNFLRYLEAWATNLHYNGSLVSMYYSEYNTGIFKCCTTVYSPPTRNYASTRCS